MGLLLMLGIQVSRAQSIFIKSGRNLTNYKFSNSANESPNLQSEVGQSYELGYMSGQPNNSRLYFALSAGLDQYNASGNYATTNLVWETNYANLKGSGYLTIFDNGRSGLSVKAGLGLATLVHGRQQINGTRYDLLKQDEFKGLFISPQVGLSYSFSINSEMDIHLDYDYGRQYSLTNGNGQKLSFIDHGISVGLSMNIN